MSANGSKVIAQLLFVGVLAVSFNSTAKLFAQASQADYDRAQGLQIRLRGKVVRDNVVPNWLNGSKQFWYEVKTGPNSQEWVLVDTDKGQRNPAFDHEKLAASLAEATSKKVEGNNLPLRDFHMAGDLGSIRFSAFGKTWSCDLSDYKVHETGTASDGATADAATTATTLDRPRPSVAEGAKTTLKFINRTANPVKLTWIDTTGERQSFGTVAANADASQNTFVGHVWLVSDENDRPLGIYEAIEKEGVVVIENPQAGGRGRGARGARGAGGFGGRHGNPNGNAVSPDGKWRATIQDHNLAVRNVDSGEVTPLTTNATADDTYTNRFYWSPDSSHLVGIQEIPGENRKVSFVESSPRSQLQPILHSIDYAKPGDKMPVDRPRMFDITNKKQVPVSEELFTNGWSSNNTGINEAHWQPDSKRFDFLFNQRGHQVLRVIGIDAASGEAKAIIDEKSPTFIDYSDKFFYRELENPHEIIWMSERDGWNHLYLYNADTGEVKNQITRGPWVVRGVDRVDEAKRQIWFRAGGIRGEQDPYYVHYCRVNFDGTGLVVMTAGDGTHLVDYSPDGKFLIDTYSRVDLAPVTELRRVEDGSLVCELEKADVSALTAMGWKPPERFVSKGRDGETDIYGIIHRPMKFDPDKKYPVVEKIYAGPQGAFVPKNFAPYYEAGALAELGFIVVQIDGMGTNERSKKFHDVCWKNLGDSGFPDRILWMRAVAEKYPAMDLTRVGVYGTSAGGQSALRALLGFGDFYKVAVSDSGCHDNRMDKIWWNEQWMGWPIGPHYAEQSNVTQAHNLTGKLMLVVGEDDTNVDPASTLQVVNALIKSNKDFELLYVPGANHGVGGSLPYAVRRSRDFFVRNLLGVEPRGGKGTMTASTD